MVNLRLVTEYKNDFLPRIKASLPFDLDKIVFDSDAIIARPPLGVELQGVQLDAGQTLHGLLSRKS